MKFVKQVSLKSYLINLSSLLGITVLLLFYIKFTSNNDLSFFDCLCKRYFHLYCPGCGGTRALVSLLKFDFMDSVLSNPVVMYFAIGILFYVIKTGILLVKNHGKYIHTFYTAWIPLGGVLGLLFFIIRNVLLIFYGIDYLGDMGQYYI